MTAEIYIQATETDPSVSALRGWSDRAGWLCAELEAKVALAADPGLASARREEARERLEEFTAGDLTRYLRAVDATLYAAAAGAADTRLLVRGLRAHHDLLTAGIQRLERTDDAETFAAGAHVLVGLLNACLHLEREVLAPALTDLAGLDVVGLVSDLTTLLAGGTIKAPERVDVREIPRGQRHPRIFTAFSRLGPGESFVLINNHDPKRLRQEFEATYPGHYRWDFLQTGPKQWRIQIGRPNLPNRTATMTTTVDTLLAPRAATHTVSVDPVSSAPSQVVVGGAVTASPWKAALDDTAPVEAARPAAAVNLLGLIPAPRGVADLGTPAARDHTSDRAPVSASITTTTPRHDRVLIQVRGRLDRVGIARLRTELAQARRVGGPQLVVDLGAVTWWDHSLLARALAWTQLQLRGRDQYLILHGVPARLRAEIVTEENALGYPLWRGICPGDPRYRPETADQP